MLKIKSHAKRAEKKELIHTLTIKQWNEIKEIFNNKCCYCGRERILEQDHFIPLSKGGAYTFNNIVPACKSCNSGKRNNDFFEWYPKQKFYSKEKEGYILKHIKEKKEGEVDVNTESVI
jgi:5-methylcytosine-specific restriction endonuclease McrA